MRKAEDRRRHVLAYLGVFSVVGPPLGLIAFFLAALPSDEHLSLELLSEFAPPVGATAPIAYAFGLVPAAMTGLAAGLVPSQTLAVKAFGSLVFGWAISFVFAYLAPQVLIGGDSDTLVRSARLFAFAGALAALGCSVITPAAVTVLRAVRRRISA